MNIPDIARKTGFAIQRNSPVILTVLSVAGVAATAWFTHQAALKAQAVIRDYEAKDNGLWIQATAKEKVDLTWRLYTPPVLMAVATASCIIGAHSVNARRQASLLSGLTLSQQALSEYRDKVTETVGEAKQQKIADETIKQRVLESDEQGDTVHIRPGEVLCHDELTGRFFSCDQETIRRAMNDINAKCNRMDYATLNEFWAKIGLDTTSLGDMMGFNTDTQLELVFTSFINKSGIPVLSYRFLHSPTTDYFDFHR